MDADVDAIAAVSGADPALAALIKQVGDFAPRQGYGNYFAALARSIMYQQLAGRAAAAIHARFVDAIGGSVTPEAVLATSPEDLRAAGLSGNKTAAVLDLA
ncbi:MAG TPA: DNA-3-methyladenine glycosylase 2 family protein, partial [Chloroflexota bacterium]